MLEDESPGIIVLSGLATLSGMTFLAGGGLLAITKGLAACFRLGLSILFGLGTTLADSASSRDCPASSGFPDEEVPISSRKKISNQLDKMEDEDCLPRLDLRCFLG